MSEIHIRIYTDRRGRTIRKIKTAPHVRNVDWPNTIVDYWAEKIDAASKRGELK